MLVQVVGVRGTAVDLCIPANTTQGVRLVEEVVLQRDDDGLQREKVSAVDATFDMP